MTWVSIGVAGASLLASEASGRSARGRERALERQAELQEQERQRQIENATSVIEAIYGSPARQRQYDDFVQALRSYFTTDLDRRKSDVDREATFALARSGLVGGSAAAESARRRNEEYLRGILDVERRAQGSLADLMSADQQSRLQLIDMARGGLDATTGARRAAEMMHSNISGALPKAQAQGLGDVFSESIGMAQRQKEAQERRRALGYDTLRQDVYGRG